MNYSCAADDGRRPGRIVLPDLPDPALAGIFALLGISLGQFYNGRAIRGILWAAGGVLLFLLIRESVLILPAGLFFLAACAIDAYSTAEEIRGRVIPPREISPLFWVEIVVLLSLIMVFGITSISRMVG